MASFIHIGPDDYTLKLALFHTTFNLLGILIMTPWIYQLLILLQWLIKEREEDVIQPKYLNRSILEHTQSTIHALLKETEHMLDHTFEIIAHSLNTHRKDILQVSNVSILLEKSRNTIPIDIDETYLKKVKNLYSKIIKYASLVQMKNLTKEELDTIINIKFANRLLVEVIKDLVDLRINLNKYLDSDNQYVGEIYDKFRKRILGIVKELFLNIIHYPYQIDASVKKEERMAGFQLDTIKENIRSQRGKIDQLDAEINQSITELISRDLIRSRMASSIINDSVFVTRICSNLLSVLELIYTEINEYDLNEG
jgi:phosphate:Na+ symporter